MNFLLFSGPPRSGKDTAAKIAWEYLSTKLDYQPNWEKFSFPNKRAFAGTMGVYCDNWGYVAGYEQTKDEIIPTLGISYRQWQIDYSESFMKVLYDNDIFARLLLDRCANSLIDDTIWKPVHIVSDCGFQVEVDALAAHNVLLFDVYRERTNYRGDSRERIVPHDSFETCMLYNNESIPMLQKAVTERIDAWLP